jgi:hypothetical protein
MPHAHTATIEASLPCRQKPRPSQQPTVDSCSVGHAETSKDRTMVTSRDIEDIDFKRVDARCAQHVVDRRGKPTRPSGGPGTDQTPPAARGGVRAAAHIIAEHRMIKHGIEISGDDRGSREIAPLQEQTKVVPPLIGGAAHWRHRMKRDEPNPSGAASTEFEIRVARVSSYRDVHYSHPWGSQCRHAVDIRFTRCT